MFCFFAPAVCAHRHPHSFPTRRSSDLWGRHDADRMVETLVDDAQFVTVNGAWTKTRAGFRDLMQRLHGANGPFRTASRRSEEHTSELQSLRHLVCRLLLEKKKKKEKNIKVHMKKIRSDKNTEYKKRINNDEKLDNSYNTATKRQHRDT